MTQHYRFVFFIVLVDVIVLVICRTGNLIAKDLAQQKKNEACGTYHYKQSAKNECMRTHQSPTSPASAPVA